jgi:tRNA(Ile)-lysidine synthase
VFLVRPFLTVTRAEVLAYLKRKRVGYRIDQSNFDTTRLRARIRAELLPQLRTYNPRIVEVLCRTAAHLREDQQTLEALRAVGVPGALGGP